MDAAVKALPLVYDGTDWRGVGVGVGRTPRRGLTCKIAPIGQTCG
jgi:hypothetical protein